MPKVLLPFYADRRDIEDGTYNRRTVSNGKVFEVVRLESTLAVREGPFYLA